MTPPSSETIGFVGLGLMGHGMAKNIVEKGFRLIVRAHRNRKPLEDLVQRGAREARDLTDLARRSSIVFLCVTGSREVEQVVAGLEPGLQAGAIVVDCSTSDPNSTLALAQRLAAKGVAYADAPLSRTPKEAWEGTLDTMVGADDAVFARLRPVLETWAGKIVHIGAVGDGHKMKLINNFISLGYAALYSEALTLAAKVGISPERFDKVIDGGRMDCSFYQTFRRWSLTGDAEAHKFTIANAYKDLRYLGAMADAAGVVDTVGAAVKNAYAVAAAAGGGDHFVPMLATYIERANGVSSERWGQLPQTGQSK